MHLDRRTLLVGGLAGAAALLLVVLDPMGLGPGRWLSVAVPADGSPAEIVASVRARRVRVRRLAAILDRDPLLSGAVLATGLGAGAVLGSVGGYLHQRRLLRRGDGDG